MNNNPLVSIIMNCYNGEKYLNEAINSVLKQKYSNWELHRKPQEITKPLQLFF